LKRLLGLLNRFDLKWGFRFNGETAQKFGLFKLRVAVKTGWPKW
jgi:hypothetical protein